MPKERLDKLIASNGTESRKDAARLVSDGLVFVNGRRVKSASEKADCETDEIIVSGKRVDLKKHIYLVLNKPKGVVSASKGKAQKTVVDLVPDCFRRNGLFPAGRLDSDTTGFVLITDDGDFAHKILSPKNHIDKTYFVTLRDKLTESAIKILENGLELRGGTKFLPSKITQLTENTCEITICEGKYHQIKRMFKAVENEVTDLKRIKMGNMNLPHNLIEGEMLELTVEELDLIKQEKTK